MATPIPPITIRPATIADADFIRGLAPRFAEAGPPPWRDPSQLARYFDRGIGAIAERMAADALGEQGAVLVAAGGDGARLGFIRLTWEPSGLTGEPQGYVGALATTPESEGHGVGRALLEAGAAWARGRGYRHLAVETFGGNRRVRALYARLGFEAEMLFLVQVLEAN